MVGIVVVSHSFRLGTEVINIASDLFPDIHFPLINASGMDDSSLGTDPARILSGIRMANSGKGVIILCDLGSSIQNSIKAIGLLEDWEKKQVFIADAPLVEGAIVASSANSQRSSISSILSEIEEIKSFAKIRKRDYYQRYN